LGRTNPLPLRPGLPLSGYAHLAFHPSRKTWRVDRENQIA